jgi:hypothetical protein
MLPNMHRRNLSHQRPWTSNKNTRPNIGASELYKIKRSISPDSLKYNTMQRPVKEDVKSKSSLVDVLSQNCDTIKEILEIDLDFI